MNRRGFLKSVLGVAGAAVAGRVAGKSEDRIQPRPPSGHAVGLAPSTYSVPFTWTAASTATTTINTMIAYFNGRVWEYRDGGWQAVT